MKIKIDKMTNEIMFISFSDNIIDIALDAAEEWINKNDIPIDILNMSTTSRGTHFVITLMYKIKYIPDYVDN